MVLEERKEGLVGKITNSICKPFMMERPVISFLPTYKHSRLLRLIPITILDSPMPVAMDKKEYGPYCKASKNLSREQAAKICPYDCINLGERKKGNINYYFRCNNPKF